jgi:uncharacterized membrane protein SpoIIM required for sporulation
MRESRFIEVNTPDWERLEELLVSPERQQSGELSRLFVKVMEDLSYARTYYANRSVRFYLNELTRKAFVLVQQGRQKEKLSFLSFWTERLPYELYQSRRYFQIAALVFSLGMAIGVFSSFANEMFPNLMLSDGYVAQTLDNIRQGDPMAIYKDEGMGQMSSWITLNNIYVTLVVFISGLLAGLGSMMMLLMEGARLGAFFTMFYEQDELPIAMLTVWQHGILEIGAIIMGGGCGLLLASGLIFPGTLSRIQAFRISAMRSVMLMATTIPMLILAGFIEGFVTRQTEAPTFLRLMVLILSSAFIILYFYVLPKKVVKERGPMFYESLRLPADNTSPLLPDVFRSSNVLFSDAFTVLRRQHWVLGWLLLPPLVITLIYGLYLFVPGLEIEQLSLGVNSNSWLSNSFEEGVFMGFNQQFTWYGILINFSSLLVGMVAVYATHKEIYGLRFRDWFRDISGWLLMSLVCLIAGACMLTYLFVTDKVTFWLLVLPVILCIFYLLSAASYFSRPETDKELGTGFSMIFFHHLAGAFNLLILFIVPIVILYSLPICLKYLGISKLLGVFTYGASDETATAVAVIYQSTIDGVVYGAIALLIGLMAAQFSYLSYELKTGAGKYQQIVHIKSRKQWQGIVRE